MELNIENEKCDLRKTQLAVKTYFFKTFGILK